MRHKGLLWVQRSGCFALPAPDRRRGSAHIVSGRTKAVVGERLGEPCSVKHILASALSGAGGQVVRHVDAPVRAAGCQEPPSLLMACRRCPTSPWPARESPARPRPHTAPVRESTRCGQTPGRCLLACHRMHVCMQACMHVGKKTVSVVVEQSLNWLFESRPCLQSMIYHSYRHEH